VRRILEAAAILGFSLCALAGCNGGQTGVPPPVSAGSPPPPLLPISAAEAAPPASETGGFDGAKAYDFTAKLVAFGPRPSGSDAIALTQTYILSQLKNFGCQVDTDDFHAETPIGSLPMKNIVAKIPGTGQGIILLLTHYDTKRLDNFVGAEDGGSSSGLMLEMAQLLCSAQKQRPYAVWIGFVDGEEAVINWDTNNDNTYGSRELAARMAISGDLKKTKAVILADMIGQNGLHIPRETDSTKWLKDLIWNTAARLGYKDVFVSGESQASDDHDSFLRRGIPAADVIDLQDYMNEGYWHTPQDTMDKISPRSLAIVGHVILESVDELQKR